jgi:hypothetical protein
MCSGVLKAGVVFKLQLSTEHESLKQSMEGGRCSEQSEQIYVSLLGVTNQEIIIWVLLNYSLTLGHHSDNVIFKNLSIATKLGYNQEYSKYNKPF